MSAGGQTAPPAAPHIPVLLDEVMEALAPIAGGIFIDGTFGAGGYARALLERGAAQVIAIDRDPEALSAGAALAECSGGRLILVDGEFAHLDRIATAHAAGPVTGVVLDIGVSSMQIDQAARGFSFLRDGPLDMRMDQAGESAADVVNGRDERELAAIIFEYGEERWARRIAKAIVAARGERPITRTAELATIVRRMVRPSADGIEPATRTFQTLRIHVNDELGELDDGIEAAIQSLAPGGRLCVIAYHSLEDRIVKQHLRLEAKGCECPPRAPVCMCGRTTRLEIRTKKPISASDEEIAQNPRARSARLRAARRVDSAEAA